jgi:hypothetical protein
MKITNKAGLPEPLLRAVRNDPYDRGDADFTVSELLQPPRAHALIHRHSDDIETDASELIYALCGQIGHLILERAGDPNMVEKRLSQSIYCGSSYGSFVVSGRADLWSQADGSRTTLVDYKFCSIWTVRDGVNPDWAAQINMLAWLARTNHIEIDHAEIVAIFRDWSKPKARRERDYPPCQVQLLPVELWEDEEVGHFIVRRIQAMIDAERGLPLCTDEERWASPEVWAVYKGRSKRAYKLCDTERQAAAVAKEIGGWMQLRPKQYKRCEDYCYAAPFCEQFQAEKGEESF